jgi:hypothetical protein
VILFMGVASPLFTRRMQPSADNLLRQMTRQRAYDARSAAAPAPPLRTPPVTHGNSIPAELAAASTHAGNLPEGTK